VLRTIVQPRRGAGGGYGDEARQRVRHLDAREALVPLRVPQQHPEVVAHVGDVRERAPGVESERGEHREDLLLVVVAQVPPLPRVEIRVVDDVDTLGLELGQELAEALAHMLHQAPGPLLDERQQALRRVTVGGRQGHPGLDLLAQARDAHHEELAEDRPDDTDELDPLQQRVGGIARLVEHPVEEVQQTELAVDVELRVAEIGVGEVSRGRQLSGELLLRGPGDRLDRLPPPVFVRTSAAVWPHERCTSSPAGARTSAPRPAWSTPALRSLAGQYTARRRPATTPRGRHGRPPPRFVGPQ